LSKHGVHPKRYFSLLFHILFSIYASYFLSHFILSYKFFHLKKVLNLLNKNCYKRFLERYFHYFQLFMILLFCIFFVFFKLILCPLVLRYRALTHNQAKIWMSMNLNMCWKPPLHWYILSNVSFEIKFISCSFLNCSHELFPIKPNSIMILSTHETCLTFGPSMQLESINTIEDKGVF
jgi:hypothetical protein